jgi:hypothetical protein
MIRKRNVGRISALILLVNVIFVLVFLTDKNSTDYQTTVIDSEGEVIAAEMVIFMDETVDGEYVTMLENIISDQKYDKEALSIVRSYEWYLTDNIVNAETYLVEDNKITIYAADDDFVTYVREVLDSVVTK